MRGRDGCRVPLPWSGVRPPFGFAADDAATWLPQPEGWASLTVERQEADPASMLALYRSVLALRRVEPAMRGGTVSWEEPGPDLLVLRRRAAGGRDLKVVVNLTEEPVELPAGEVLVGSSQVDGGMLAGESAVVLA